MSDLYPQPSPLEKAMLIEIKACRAVMQNTVSALRARIAELEYANDQQEEYILGLEAANRWIPVGERLPDEGSAVLVWDMNAPQVGWLEDGLWQDERQNYLAVTYWIPLPEPPEAVK